MPRYILDVFAQTPQAPVPSHTSPESAVGDFGVFRFDGYAVSIKMDDHGMRAERLVKAVAWPSPWHALLYWLKSVFKAEGGASWYLDKRDSAEVIGQSWAAHRQCHLQSFTASFLPPPAEKLSVLPAAEPAWARLLQCLDTRERAALALASKDLYRSMQGELALQRALVRIGAAFSLPDLQQIAADYGLDTSLPGEPAGENQLASRQKEALMAALAKRVPMLVAERDVAIKYLCGLATAMDGRSGQRLRAVLLMSLTIAQRAMAAPVLVPDTAGYASLIRALTPEEQRQWLANITRDFLGKPGPPGAAVSRWDELLADAKGDLVARPPLAARRLLALAVCLKKLDPGRPGNRELSAVALERWHVLQQQLKCLPVAEAVELACTLARSLGHTKTASIERAKAVALLDDWQASVRLTCEQDVGLLARLKYMGWMEDLVERWSKVWDRIETEQLSHLGAQAARELAWVPAQEGWQRVLALCEDPRKASPQHRAEMLLVLIDFVDMVGYLYHDLRDEAMKPRLYEAAYDVMERGGPVAPLLRCQWRPKVESAGVIRRHLGWPLHCQALVQWLEYRDHRILSVVWRLEDLVALRPDMERLVAHIQHDGNGAARDAGRRVAIAVAQWADMQVTSRKQHLESGLVLAQALLPLVQATCRHDATGAALAGLAQLVNTIMLVEKDRWDDGPKDARIDPLFEATWALVDDLPADNRSAMLASLIALKALRPSNETNRWVSFWTESTLLRAAQAISKDMAGCAHLLERLACAQTPLDGLLGPGARFSASRAQIYAKAMALPDEQFAVVAQRLAMWFHGWRESRLEAPEKQARAAFVARVRRLPKGRYEAERQVVAFWMGPR